LPNLTKRFVDALKPVTRDTLYRDSILKGFALRLKPPSADYPAGARTWVVQYRNKAGRTRKLRLGEGRGNNGHLTPKEARDLAKAALTAVAIKGRDPSADRHASGSDPTIGELVERYLSEGPADKPTKKASSWSIDASNLRRHAVPLLGNVALSALTTKDVQLFQSDVTQGKTKATGKGERARGRMRVRGGSGTAWRATVVLAGMLAWAVERGLRRDNPAKGVRLNKLTRRERFLSGAELAKLGEALGKMEAQRANPHSLAIVRLLILTGARRNEIASLKWEHVDFERKALRLADSKTGQKVVPLGAPALDVLAKLPRVEGSSWVFPAARGEGYHQGVPGVWRKLVKVAGLKDVRLHDLRHGFASVAVADGGSLYLVGKVLGHTQAATTQRYSHLELDPVLAVADRTARKIASALQGRDGNGEVVPLHRGSR